MQFARREITALFVLVPQITLGMLELHVIQVSTTYLPIYIPQCLRSEKKFHFDFDFFHFYLIKSVIWQPPAMHPGDWPE